MVESLALGIDIGGSHITCAPVDLDTQNIIETGRRRAYVDSMGTAGEVIDAWATVIVDCCEAMNKKPLRIGIAIPGPFDYELGISYIRDQDKYDSLYGLNVKTLLAERIGVEEHRIAFSNDAACYLQGEVVAGAGRGYSHVLGLTLGTGFGSAISHPGELIDAELWCVPHLGKQAEDFFSTRWFVSRYREVTGIRASNVKEMLDGKQDGPATQQVFTEFGQNLGRFLAPYCVREEFEMVVMGGNISNAFGLFETALDETLREHGVQVELRKSELNENASLLGAANLELNHGTDQAGMEQTG